MGWGVAAHLRWRHGRDTRTDRKVARSRRLAGDRRHHGPSRTGSVPWGQAGSGCPNGRGRARSTSSKRRRKDGAREPRAAPRQDWEQKRFGPMPPAANIQLWHEAMEAVMSALGINPSLYTSQGSALRESLAALIFRHDRSPGAANCGGAVRKARAGHHHHLP